MTFSSDNIFGKATLSCGLSQVDQPLLNSAQHRHHLKKLALLEGWKETARVEDEAVLFASMSQAGSVLITYQAARMGLSQLTWLTWRMTQAYANRQCSL